MDRVTKTLTERRGGKIKIRRFVRPASLSGRLSLCLILKLQPHAKPSTVPSTSPPFFKIPFLFERPQRGLPARWACLQVKIKFLESLPLFFFFTALSVSDEPHAGFLRVGPCITLRRISGRIFTLQPRGRGLEKTFGGTLLFLFCRLVIKKLSYYSPSTPQKNYNIVKADQRTVLKIS